MGNFQFYDPISKILFSGDLGASMVDEFSPVDAADFDAHIPKMLGFHRRYMAGNRACVVWADMAREMDIEMIVPQHGRPIRGKAVARFIDWIRQLECGTDLLTGPGRFRDSLRLVSDNVAKIPRAQLGAVTPKTSPFEVMG